MNQDEREMGLLCARDRLIANLTIERLNVPRGTLAAINSVRVLLANGHRADVDLNGRIN
jgi:hypothetical protein